MAVHKVEHDVGKVVPMIVSLRLIDSERDNSRLTFAADSIRVRCRASGTMMSPGASRSYWSLMMLIIPC